jgi:hypothetical protein
MDDLVETAVENHWEQIQAESGDAAGFGEPTTVFIGCGSVGAQIAADGLDSRVRSSQYPDVETIACQTNPIPEPVTAETVIMTGDLSDSAGRELLPAVASATPVDTLAIALPILPSSETERWDSLSTLVETADTVVPVARSLSVEAIHSSTATATPDRRLVRELAADLVAMLAARLPWSPPPHRLWPALQTGGLTAAYRGRLPAEATDSTPQEIATTLVTSAVEHPLDPASRDSGTNCLSLLCGDQSMTLAEAQLIRETISEQVRIADSTPVFSVSIPDSTNTYRLTLFLTGCTQGQLC